LDILYPFPGQISEDANNMSVVAKLIYGKTCFILTGDLERVGEFKLLGDDISCEVLKIGHHGSKTSTSDAFLAAIAPKFAVIQSGEDNKYGHPNGIVLNKLQAADIAALRNDELGLIKIRSDGERVWLDK
ncbi:MAG: MBL fold metallo-hydrolase, partial [Patescibacteria group bacterium]